MNRAGLSGGAINTEVGDVSDCLFRDNEAGLSGGALMFMKSVIL